MEFAVVKQGERERLVIKDIKAAESMAKDWEPAEFSGDAKFTIQIFALKNRRSINYFDDLIGVQEHIGEDGFYRYTVGEFKTKSAAKNAMQNLREKGYDPFVRKTSYFNK